MLKKGKLIPLIFSGVTAAAVSLATVSCSFEHNPLTIEGPTEFMVEVGGSIDPKTDYDPYKVELHEAQIKTGVTMSINPINHIDEQKLWNNIQIDEEGYLHTVKPFAEVDPELEPCTLSFKVHAEYKDEKENKNYECDSDVVSLAIVEPSSKKITVEGGSPSIDLKKPIAEIYQDETPWEMKVEGEPIEATFELYSETDPEVGTNIYIDQDDTDDKWYVFVDTDTASGTHTFQVKGTGVAGNEELTASANVTVVVTDADVYTLTGGTTAINAFSYEAGVDEGHPWVLYKNGEPVSATLQLNGAPTGVDLNTNNELIWPNTLAANTYNFGIKTTGSEISTAIPITLTITDGEAELADGSLSLQSNSGQVKNDPAPWVLYRNNVKVTDAKFTVEKTGTNWPTSSTLNIGETSGAVTWGIVNDNPASQVAYTFVVKASSDMYHITNATSAPVTITVDPADAVITGGTDKQNITDLSGTVTTNPFVLQVNSTTVAKPTWTVTESGSAVTWAQPSTTTPGAIDLTAVPAGTHTLTVTGTDASTEEHIPTGASASATLTVVSSLTEATINFVIPEGEEFEHLTFDGATTVNVTAEGHHPGGETATKWSQVNTPTPVLAGYECTGWKFSDGTALTADTVFTGTNSICPIMEEVVTPVTDIVINGPAVITSGQENQFSATCYPSGTTGTIKWSIGDWDCGNKPTIDENTGVLTTEEPDDGSPGVGCEVVATDTVSGVSDSKWFDVMPPYFNSTDIWTYSSTGTYNKGWYRVEGLTDPTATNITLTDFSGVKPATQPTRASFNMPLHIGSDVQIIGDHFLEGCASFESTIQFTGNISKCTVIGDSFMEGCTKFNKTIELPNSVTRIGEDFMAGCSLFNNGDDAFKLPTNLQRIGDEFLWKCSAFNRSFTIPSTVEYIGFEFMQDCSSMQGTITVGGNVSAFQYSTGCLSFATLAEHAPVWFTNGITIKVSDDTQQTALEGMFPTITGTEGTLSNWRKLKVTHS